ncbi:MAG TPA: YaaR family protein [Bacillales bacterium]|nr:YaaR family protein [Bacillales bacterium]
MKISQDMRAQHDKGRQTAQTTAKESGAFSGIVKEQEAKLHKEGLDRLFADIQKQAQRVIQSRTVGEFLRFKKQVQQFVKEAVHSDLELSQSKDWHHRGGSRTMTTVKKIDGHLTELTDHFINDKRQSIDLLAKIGELQGLLINLYR